jgi:endonuclease G, mitochondrial
MKMTRNQRFGLITFVLLMIIACLVTLGPFTKDPAPIQAVMYHHAPPHPVSIHWKELAEGYPQAYTADTVLSYSGFDLGYNEEFEQASWVAYVLTRMEVMADEVERTENFRSDTSIHTGSSHPSDYRGSGFDRGHLVPAADMSWDLQAMSESFLMSNMSPQLPGFNRGIWKRLEEQVRDWAIEKESLYVITGPVLNSVDTLIGPNGVGVPAYYFKVLVDLSPPDHSFIGFLLPHERLSGNLDRFAITVDSLESFTGYDFFASAPDQEVIRWLESWIDLDDWR